MTLLEYFLGVELRQQPNVDLFRRRYHQSSGPSLEETSTWQEEKEAGQHGGGSVLVTVQWESVSRLSPGKAVAMAMALAAP